MAWIAFGTQDWTWAPKDRVRSKVTPRNLGVGLNKRGSQEVQSGLESGLMGICREKGRLTLLWIEWKSP